MGTKDKNSSNPSTSMGGKIRPSRGKQLVNQRTLVITGALVLAAMLAVVMAMHHTTTKPNKAQTAVPTPPPKLINLACKDLNNTPFWAKPCGEAFVSAYKKAYAEFNGIKISGVSASLRATREYGHYVFSILTDKNFICAYVDAVNTNDVNIVVGKKIC